MHMLGYTKWEYWPLTVTKRVQCLWISLQELILQSRQPTTTQAVQPRGSLPCLVRLSSAVLPSLMTRWSLRCDRSSEYCTPVVEAYYTHRLGIRVRLGLCYTLDSWVVGRRTYRRGRRADQRRLCEKQENYGWNYKKLTFLNWFTLVMFFKGTWHYFVITQNNCYSMLTW